MVDGVRMRWIRGGTHGSQARLDCVGWSAGLDAHKQGSRDHWAAGSDGEKRPITHMQAYDVRAGAGMEGMKTR
jgi:hypothetical protein